MSGGGWLGASRRWLRLLLWLYPVDFREEMGDAMVATYMERCRSALAEGGVPALLRVWHAALGDAARNGPGERLHPAVGWRRRGNWGRDMELTVRRLARAPLFAASIVATLGVGLGAFAVVFAAVHNVLLAPMPYADPDDLYYVWRDYRAIFDLDRGWLAGTDVVELQRAGGVIEDAAALFRGRATLSAGGEAEPSEITVMVTTPNVFELLGVRPALGRGFAPDETGPGQASVMVLTHALWQRLGGDPGIVGRTLRLNGEESTVIGVLPRDFHFVRNASLGPPQDAEAYIPFEQDLATTNPNAGSYAGLIRARRGASPEAVQATVAGVGAAIDERDFASRGLKLWAVGLKPDLVAGVRPALTVLGLAGVFLVLVLLVNLATLLLARAGRREQEFAVSRALGANPAALTRATLFEGAMLGLLGGIAGTGAAVWGTRLLVSMTPLELPRRDEIAVDATVAIVAIGAGVVLGLLAALVPAVWAGRTSLAALLRNSAVRGGGGGHGRTRRAMVVMQVALSLALLVAGGLVVRSFEGLLRSDAGFVADDLLTFRVPLPAYLFAEDAAARAAQDRLVEGLAALPGVSGASATGALPLSAGASQTTITIPGAPGLTGDAELDAPLVDHTGVRAGYFDVMGIRVVEGRAFARSSPDGVREALIDEVIARQFFPASSPLGARIPFAGDTLTIIGVVKQARLYDLHRDGRGQIYLRAEDWLPRFRTLSFVVRSGRDPASLLRDVRAVARAVDPEIAISDVRTMRQIVDDSLRQQRTTAVLIGAFSLGALLLTAMGLFGVVATAVNRRRHEIAVRLALGADHARVLRLVLGEGARLILLGVLIGVPATLLAGSALRGVLVGVTPTDPLTLAVVALVLGTIALVACYIPARRVLRIEPGRSLREE